MKVAVFFSALVAGVSAFAPASQQRATSSLAASADLESMRGVSVEIPFAWDPLNLSDYADASFLRKAELSNGRSAMLATVGWVFPKYIGTFDGPVDTVDPVKAILASDPQWWAQFIIFCATIEGIKYRAEAEGKSYTGDGPAAIDWSKNWPKLSDAAKEDMALKELKNGRLAMIGFASFVANYFIPGSVPGLPADF